MVNYAANRLVVRIHELSGTTEDGRLSQWSTLGIADRQRDH